MIVYLIGVKYEGYRAEVFTTLERARECRDKDDYGDWISSVEVDNAEWNRDIVVWEREGLR